MNLKIPSHILEIAPYEPGKPMETLEREYGISGSIKLASNENPLGPSPRAVEAVRGALHTLNRYPDGAAHLLVEKLSDRLGVSPKNIILGNGSDEILELLSRALLQRGDEAVIPRPSFLMYEITVRSAGAVPVFVPLKELQIDLDALLDHVTEKTRIVFICNPNNPTGTVVSKMAFENFLSKLPEDVLVVVDEAYFEFVSDPDSACGVDHLDSDRAVVTLRTFSKAYGLAGLRIGYGIVPEAVWDVLNRIRLPFNASIPAQLGAAAALDDTDFLKKTVDTVHRGLEFLFPALSGMGFTCFSTQANFFLVDVKRPAGEAAEELMRQGIIVRSMASYGFPTCIRVSVGLQEENERLVDAMGRLA